MDKCGVDLRMCTISELKKNTFITNHMDTIQNKMFCKNQLHGTLKGW